MYQYDGDKYKLVRFPHNEHVSHPTLRVQRIEASGHTSDCAVNALRHFLDMNYQMAEALLLNHTSYSPSVGVRLDELIVLMARFNVTYTHKAQSIIRVVPCLPHQAMLVFANHICAYNSGIIYDVQDTLCSPWYQLIMGYFTKDLHMAVVTCYKKINNKLIEADQFHNTRKNAIKIAEGLTTLSIYEKIEIETDEGIILARYVKDERSGLYQKGF